MIYIILIWVNWRVIYQANRRWTWKPKKSHRKLGVETSPFRGVSRRLFPSLVCPPVVSSRYGASEKSMARWMKLYWGKGFSIANMIACGVGCSKGVFSINACICSTLFPLIWFRRKHQCVHDTGNFFFCFAFFSIRKHHTLAFWTACCLNDPFGWKKSDQQQIIGFIEISSQWALELFPWILQPERYDIFELFLSFPLKKHRSNISDTNWFPWKMHGWTSLNISFVVKPPCLLSKKYLPISRIQWDRGVDQSWSRPRRFFFPKKNGENCLGPESKVPDLPIFLRFTLWKVGREDLISIPGMAWSMNTSQPGKRQKNGRIFRGLERKLVVDTLSQWNDTTWLLILIG